MQKLPRLIVITPPDGDEVAECNALFKSGLARLHIRKPNWSAVEIERFVAAIEPDYRGRVVLHSAYQLVDAYALAGAHYPERVRLEGGFFRSDSGTNSSSWHLGSHPPLGAFDYGFLGPLFQSISKAGWGNQNDSSTVSNIVSAANIPLYALGGVSADRVEQVKSLGFSGVAVLGAVWLAACGVVRAFMELDRRCQEVWS